MTTISSTSFTDGGIIVLARKNISNVSVDDLEAAEESQNIHKTSGHTSIHVNPYFDAVQLKLPRFNARDFYIFANIGKNTSFRQSMVFKSKTDIPAYHEDVLRTLAQSLPGSPTLHYFLVGVYPEIIKYAKVLDGDDGIAPANTIINWLGFCRDPYTLHEMSNIYSDYDSFQSYGSGKWIVGPADDGVLTWDSLNWSIEDAVSNPNQISIYGGSEFLEPDYSVERFEQDYLGIMTCFVRTIVGGSSAFFLLWPVNGTSSALYGLLSLLFQEFRISKDIKKSPIDPGVILFANKRREVNSDLVKHLCRRDRFMKNLSFFEHAADGAFHEYFEKIRPSYNKHYQEISQQWEL